MSATGAAMDVSPGQSVPAALKLCGCFFLAESCRVLSLTREEAPAPIPPAPA